MLKWPGSAPVPNLSMLYVNNLNLTLLFPKIWNAFIYAFGCFATFFLCEEWKEILWSLFSFFEDHCSSLVHWFSVQCGPVFGYLASMRKPYCSPCKSEEQKNFMVRRKKQNEGAFFSIFLYCRLYCTVLWNRQVGMSTLEMMVISCTFWHLQMLGVSLHLESLTEQQLLASADTPLLVHFISYTCSESFHCPYFKINFICLIKFNNRDCHKAALQKSECKCRSQLSKPEGRRCW